MKDHALFPARSDKVFKNMLTTRSASSLESTEVTEEENTIDLLHNQGSVDFSVLLSRFLSQIRGGISTTSILPHEFDSKIGQNNPKNRRTLKLARGLFKGGFYELFITSRNQLGRG